MKNTSKISEFKIGKGRTTTSKKPEEWTKKHLELTVKLPEQFSEEDFHEAVIRAEYIIDNFLEQGEAPQIPQVDPEQLMKHEGWKARKTGEGQYAEGSLSWGWDFMDKFSKEVIEALKKGPVTIDQYEFSLNKEQNLVSVKKKKETAK